MFWEDLRKLLAGPMLFRLDALLGAKLVPLLYALGLAAIGLWAIDHLFVAFAFNFGQGLWGILEVMVYGPLLALALRIACEVVLIFLKAHEAAAAAVNRGRHRSTLLEDVGGAIHDLALDDDPGFPTVPEPMPPPGDAGPRPYSGGGGAAVGLGGGAGKTIDVDPIIKGTTPRRTARRSPPNKP